MATTALQEFAAEAPKGVDRDKRVIRGVKLLGTRSVNRGGYAYPDSTLASAVSLFEGKPAYVDHKPRPRSLADRFGTIRAPRFEPGRGIYGDIEFNPKHALTEQVLEAAEKLPESFGCSPSMDGDLVGRGAQARVERIIKVDSVDLVAEPATSSGIYESRTEGDRTMDLTTATLDQILASRPDLKVEIEKRNAATDEIKTLREQVESLTKSLEESKKAADEATKAAASAKARAEGEKKITEAKLPSWLLTDAVKTELLEAAETGKLDDRLKFYGEIAKNAGPQNRAAGDNKPVSKIQESAGKEGAVDVSGMDLKTFAGRLTSRAV